MTLDDAQLARLLQAVAQSDTDISRKALCQRILQGLTMKLLGTQRFYGELLTGSPGNLTRHFLQWLDWATAQRKDLSYYSIQHFLKRLTVLLRR